MNKPKLLSVKLLSILMIVAVLVTLAACGKSKSTTTPTATSPAPTATPTATTTPPRTPTPTPTPVTPTPTPMPPASIPPEITQYAQDWPLPQHDYANTRATMDSSINSSNINTLGVAWTMPITGTGLFGSAAGIVPIIQGNTVYFQDLELNTFAINKTTGKVLWSHVFDQVDGGPAGTGVGYGKVFIPLDPFNVAALDAKTGNLLWSQPISTSNTIGIDFQPIPYDGMVLSSSVPGSSLNNFYAGGAYGVFYSMDQATGKILWNWNTIDDPKGFWGHPEINSGGGAWFPPAVDTKTGITYWGTGNPGPLGGTKDFPNGSSRPGPNLYTSALIAIDHNTGKMLWYNQPWPHDINDYDLEASPVLASANYNGQQQDIVIAAGKMGQVYAFNRQTGALLWQCAVGKHENDLMINHPVPQGQTSMEVFPGALGGVESPIAYADGVVYVASNNLPTNYTPEGIAGFKFSGGTGNLTAIDVNLGRWLWNVDLPADNYGGATVVNDLVFTATVDGTIYAFKRATGEQVWTYKAPAGINAWPAVSGDMIIWPAGSGGAPSLIAFKLGANAPIGEIARPVDGSTIPAGDVTVVAAAFNLKIVDKLGLQNVPGEGHLHYFLDAPPPTTPGQPAVTGPGTYAATTNTTYTWKNVTPGTHTLSIELVNNDHTPLVPPATATVTVNVQANPPAVKITAPPNHSTVQPGPVTITVNLTNFTTTTGTGLTNNPNQGKIIYYMDSGVPDVPGQLATTSTSVTSSDTSYTFQMPAGTHTFSVQLVNNDLTTLPIPAQDSVVVQNGLPPVYTGP